jgi:hypothetical protein
VIRLRRDREEPCVFLLAMRGDVYSEATKCVSVRRARTPKEISVPCSFSSKELAV